MEQNPIVSVIMNCYNSSQFLKEAIDSVYAQTFKDWEIIFWDNVSTDNSAEIAKSYDSKLRYFKGEKTVPLGAARNLALNKVSGEYVAFLDCDDIWVPDKLAKQADIFSRDNRVGFIYTNFFVSNEIQKSKTISDRIPQPAGNIFRTMLARYSIGLLTTLIRKNALLSAGELFDESLSYAEEYDLFMRMLYSAKAAYLFEPLAVYRVHQNMSSANRVEGNYKEVLYCLEKFRKLESNFDEKYRCEIEECKMRSSYYSAIRFFYNNEPKLAAEYLKNYKYRSFKMFLYYFAAKMPSFLWRAAFNLLELAKNIAIKCESLIMGSLRNK